MHHTFFTSPSAECVTFLLQRLLPLSEIANMDDNDKPMDVGEGEMSLSTSFEEQLEVPQEQEDLVTGTPPPLEREEQEIQPREEENYLEDGRGNEEGEAGILKLPKRKLREVAPVWLCGGESLPNGKDQCTLCGRTFVSETSNTSNLRDHILRKHSKTPEGLKLKKLTEEKREKVAEKKKSNESKKVAPTPKQTSVVGFITKTKAMDPKKKRKVEEALVKFITTETKPFNIVEKHSFRELLSALDPDYVVPSEHTIRRRFDKYADKIKEEMIQELKKDLDGVVDKVVNLTSDHGTSHDRFQTHKNALTLSRCTKDFVIKIDTVDVIHCVGSQTGEQK